MESTKKLNVSSLMDKENNMKMVSTFNGSENTSKLKKKKLSVTGKVGLSCSFSQVKL